MSRTVWAWPDMTVDHALGGPTVPGNGGPLCRKDHRKKHRGGWRLDQPAPGRFRWTSPLGQVYSTRGEPIWPELPEPLPAHRAAADRAVAGRAVADRANPGPTPPIIDASPPTGHRAPAETGPAPPEPDPPPF